MRAGIHLGRTKGLIHTAMTVGAETFAEHITRRPAATGDTAEATRRGAQLDALLGDPHAPANPHGLTNLLAADARHRPPGETEWLLARAGLGAEFVPVAHGGRLTRVDLLDRVLRPVSRRDVTLGYRSGLGSLLAACAVWTSGTEQQRASTAALLLGGGRIAGAPQNGPARGEIVARPTTGGFRLDGRGEGIIDGNRADAYVVHARTGPAGTPHSDSVLLLRAGRPGLRILPGPLATGLRGAPCRAVELTDCAAPDRALIGGVGEGVALGLRSRQVGDCLVPGLLVTASGTALHSAVRASCEGRSDGIAHRWQGPLAGVFADLLACDSLATVAMRALSLLPDRAQVPAAAARYLVPGVLRENLEQLTSVLGARGHERDSARYGMLGRLMRDLPAVAPATSAADCQSVIAPQLRELAERSWFAEDMPPPGLFRLCAELPAFDHRLLTAVNRGDFLASTLLASAARVASVRGIGGQIGVLSDLAGLCVGELRELRERLLEMPAPGAGEYPVAAWCALTDRYALVAAAAAVLGVWESQDGSDPFLAAPAWAVLALIRIVGRLGLRAPEPPADVLETVRNELVRRQRGHISFDLHAAVATW